MGTLQSTSIIKRLRKTDSKTQVTPSKTPQKRGRKKVDGDADTETPTKKKRTPAKAGGEKGAKAGSRPMPTSYDNASEEDKMMLRMKDDEGKGWNEIREAWNAMTGETVGKSTLSGRYGRIKANFVVFRKEDVSSIESWIPSCLENPILPEEILLENPN